MSPATLRLTILRALKGNAPYATPFAGLLAHVNEVARPPVSAPELKDHLRRLLDGLMVDFLPDDLDPENEDARRWVLREAGEAALRK